jgi:hypothetical protein
MERRFILTASRLADALKRAADAHHAFIAQQADRQPEHLKALNDDWPAWYAQYVADAAPSSASVQPAADVVARADGWL